jgi:hypothetical protein
MHLAILVAWFAILPALQAGPKPFKKMESETLSSPRAEKTILFSGYEWKLRNTEGLQGPGPNYFSEKSVWVDEKGFLHMFLHKDSATGNWLCPEITSLERFGYGTYSFAVEGAIDKFDKNIVLGLFNFSGHDAFDEMDIEFARWGNDSFPNLNYTVWPAKKIAQRNSTYGKEYVQESKDSYHEFKRTADSIVFSSFNGSVIDSRNLVATHTFIQPPVSISTLEMPVHLNLWLFQGTPPANNKPVEVIVHSFGFQK